jgi:hypothetical protein
MGYYEGKPAEAVRDLMQRSLNNFPKLTIPGVYD